ncbi:MAG: enoyl-CoA hydratase/isomerase family protein [Phycisphaerales bacterium]|nr:MAG: enoyl-CoA hydratase/isomerase family protein [Phycisphaerales bacterium]
MNQLVLSEQRDGLRLLTLNRPQKRNALTVALLKELHAATGEAIEDEAVRCIAITGAGPGFCAGMDLHEVQELREDPPRRREAGDIFYETFDRLYHCPKPTIAAVNGPAVAGGAGLMTVCDLVIAAETARVGYPEVKRGLVAAIVMVYLTRQIGERRAKQLLLTGELVSASRAAEMGLVNEVVPADQLMARVEHWANVFLESTPDALERTKRVLIEIQGLDKEKAAAYVRAVHEDMRSVASAEGAISKFLNHSD